MALSPSCLGVSVGQGEKQTLGWVQGQIQFGDTMNITTKTIETTRAFIRYENIQHISWEYLDGKKKVLLKIHSGAQDYILEECSLEEFQSFYLEYKAWAFDSDGRDN